MFDIIVTEYSADSYARVRITDYHTNIVLIEKDKKILFEKPLADPSEESAANSRADRSLLNMEDIWDFICTADTGDLAPVLDRQIQYNYAIAEEGIRGDYGANIGSVLLKTYGNDISVRAKAMAAAGSDARMNGCELPVIINSGSGNQGITCSVPLIEYAENSTLTKTPCTGLSPSQIWSRSMKRPASEPSLHTVVQSAQEPGPELVLPICAAEIIPISFTQLSTRLP